MNLEYTSPHLPKNLVDQALIPVTSHWIGSWRFSLERKALTTQEITNRYNDQAIHWQRKLSRMGIPESYAQLAKMIEQRLSNSTKRQTPIRVLDCGVGTAELQLALFKRWHSAIEICAIDLSPDMLNQAELAFSYAGIHAELEVGDIRQLPYSSQSFDLVVATHVLEHLSDPCVALAEIDRVLKPGGLMLTCCTQRSLLGSMIQMKWRTHTVTRDQMQNWLSQHQFQTIEFASAGNQSLLDRLSLICFAQKKSQIAGAA